MAAHAQLHSRLKVFTRRQALDWIGARVSPNQEKEDRTSSHKLTPVDIAMQALAAMVLGHVPVRNMNFRPKCIYLATMTRRVLMAMVDESMVDDRDYVGNKRLELYVALRQSELMPSEQASCCRYCSRIPSRPTIPRSRNGWISFWTRRTALHHSTPVL